MAMRPMSVKSGGGGIPCLTHVPLIPCPFTPLIPPCPPYSPDLLWSMLLAGKRRRDDAAARSAPS